MRDYSLIRDDETLDDLDLKDIYVIQKKQGFRFGIDAVLLANFAKIKKNDKIIDFCSGTGIIPFVITGKNELKSIKGIEIQEEMVDMALRSVEYNNLQDKITFICGDLRNEVMLNALEKVDVVTVNPPYKLLNTGIINISNKNAIARHEICCTLEDVIKASNVVLKDRGRLYMVHRPERIADIMVLMRKYKIEPKAIRMIQPSVNKAPNIVLVEGQKNGGKFLKFENTLYVYDDKGNYTDEINKIYGKENERNE